MPVLEREPFLEQLDELLMEATRGRGRLVLVRGEAGIGKSTLVEAFASGRGNRVWWGACDPLDPPRPLAPVIDIAGSLGGVVADAVAGGEPHQIINALLTELRAEGGPRVLVFEDLQWADEASLEVLRVLGRRLAQLPAMVIGTVRDEEVTAGHPLSVALGDIPRASMTAIELPRLSVEAVEILAEGTDLDARALHAAAAGNPFFVTEVISAGSTQLPATVRDAVWARARRLSDGGLWLTQSAAVLGDRCELSVLNAIPPGGTANPGAVAECVDRGILIARDDGLEFRHELVRQAILDVLTPSDLSALEAGALAALRELPGADHGRIARHAAAAGDAAAVLEFAPSAGARASAVGAHRQAKAFYAMTLPFISQVAGARRGELLAAFAHECFLLNEIPDAVRYQEMALEAWRAEGDVAAEGAGLEPLSRYLFWAKEAQRSRQAAIRGVELLESLPSGAATPALARAYAGRASTHMIAGEGEAALEWGQRALALGEELDDEHVVIHVLNTMGVAETLLGLETGWDKLEESLRRARAAELEEDISRGLNNVISLSREHHRYDVLDRAIAEMDAFAAERDLDQTVQCLFGDIIESQVDRGQWGEAHARAQGVIDREQQHGHFQSLRALGRLAARQGSGDPFPLLDASLKESMAFGYTAESAVTHAARAEAAWLAGDPRAAAAAIEAGLASAVPGGNPWQTAELLFWAWKLGIPYEWPAPLPEPYAHHLEGHPDKAAAAWAAIGCPYEQARALLDCEREDEVREALEIFRSLGAKPGMALATERLKAMGAKKIARGPRRSTSANPHGLTDRELDVLRLLGEGLTNNEIAQRLVVSAKTVDHHVSAILAKLEVRNRHEAGQAAIRLGLAPT